MWFLTNHKILKGVYRILFLLTHVSCSQIWLNLPMDYRHFGYITKLTPKSKTLESWNNCEQLCCKINETIEKSNSHKIPTKTHAVVVVVVVVVE